MSVLGWSERMWDTVENRRKIYKKTLFEEIYSMEACILLCLCEN